MGYRGRESKKRVYKKKKWSRINKYCENIEESRRINKVGRE